MRQRTLLKQMSYVTGGLVLSPSCLHDRSKAAILLKQLSIGGDEAALMMVDDCYKKDDQQKFIKALKAFEAKAKTDFDTSYVHLSPEEKAKPFSEIEAQKVAKDDLFYFCSTTKQMTNQAYGLSKIFINRVQVDELVPGSYPGYLPVKKSA